MSLKTLALVSGAYDLLLALPMLFAAPLMARLFGAPEPVPLLNAHLNGVFTLTLAAGYYWAAGAGRGHEGAHGDEVDRHRHELVGGQPSEARPFADEGCDHRRPDVGHDRVRGAVVGRPVRREPEAPRRGRNGALRTGRQPE